MIIPFQSGAPRHYQFLTGETGIPHLDKQIASITMLMPISEEPGDFEENFKKAFAPVYQQRLPLVIEVSAEDELTIRDGTGNGAATAQALGGHDAGFAMLVIVGEMQFDCGSCGVSPRPRDIAEAVQFFEPLQIEASYPLLLFKQFDVLACCLAVSAPQLYALVTHLMFHD